MCLRFTKLCFALIVIVITLVAGLASSIAQLVSDSELEPLNARVIALYQAGKYAEAIPLARRYAAGIKARSGDNAPDYATALNNLAQLLEATNRLAEAEPLMRRALAIDEKSFGPEHPKVFVDLNNLAMLLKETNRLAEAEPPPPAAMTHAARTTIPPAMLTSQPPGLSRMATTS